MKSIKKLTLFIGLLLFALLSFSCSQSPDDAALSANSGEMEVFEVSNITDPNHFLAEGKRLLDENQTERAIEHLQHAVTLDPDLAEGHFQLGIAYSLLEMQYEREGIITETANDNSGTKKMRSERSFERAVDAYEKWLKANPDDDMAHFTLGRTYSKLLKDEEAEKAFKEAVKLKPDDSEYQTELGAILIKLAKYHEAIAPLKKAIELDAENVRAEELLEDAQAGRQRIDYVSKPDSNKPASNKSANSNSATNANSNASAPPRPTNANMRPPTDPSKKPTPAFNKPE